MSSLILAALLLLAEPLPQAPHDQPPSAGFIVPGADPHVAEALYYDPLTIAALERDRNARIEALNARVLDLAARVRAGQASETQLAEAEEALIVALTSIDAEYAEQIGARRSALLSGSAPPEALPPAPTSEAAPPPGATSGGSGGGGGLLGALPPDEASGRGGRYSDMLGAASPDNLPGAAQPQADAAGASEMEQRRADDERARQAAAAAYRQRLEAERQMQESQLQGRRYDEAQARAEAVLRGSPPPPSPSASPPSASPPPSARVLPAFPWPPPTPSERLNLTRGQILPAAMRAHPSLADVGDRIVGALQAAGYSEFSFYSAPQGFAIVARLERVEPDGTPAPQQLRFLSPGADEPFSLSAYVTRLFFAPEGYYRQIVFAVTTDVIRPRGRAPDAAAAEALLEGGADRLPPQYRAMPFTGDYQVAALIYEYHKGPQNRDVRTLNPGRIDARTNLMRAGIYRWLVAAR